MDLTWIVRGLTGGALIGLAASVLLVLNGRVTGISGIVNGLLSPALASERTWRVLFVLGLVGGGLLALPFLPNDDADTPALGVAIAAGALVGVGTRLANGCTSGHGVCGLSRLSGRSLVATLTFIATGAIAVLAARGHAVGVTP